MSVVPLRATPLTITNLECSLRRGRSFIKLFRPPEPRHPPAAEPRFEQGDAGCLRIAGFSGNRLPAHVKKPVLSGAGVSEGGPDSIMPVAAIRTGGRMCGGRGVANMA